ncbi:Monothiol glutaredoxin-S14, chloroplastic [Capsicum annuum]|uniref:Monothiol glutaredoxin-S14, chloroplastic n=1 Tax=Capsicum annuum TaxID=4072 RepID=A0A2G3A9C8_CAPAN|nr:Monothiol glutaredoxin-S14, chloroplastic [Capsicum annuum]
MLCASMFLWSSDIQGSPAHFVFIYHSIFMYFFLIMHGMYQLILYILQYVSFKELRIADICLIHLHAYVALDPNLKATLDKVVTSQKIVLFMKGTKDFPQCGFSHTVVQILKSLDAPFETINILENEALRQGLKEYSSWPTFPQLYVDGEFFGGCDITVEAYKSGELQELLERTLCS